MNHELRSLARVMFGSKIHKADGQAFEDLFTQVMNYAKLGFRSIKPWGNIGDRKNDGYSPDEGIYYQVFAPEDIRKSHYDCLQKTRTDFQGLYEQWPNVRRYFFVVNDKYKGVHPDVGTELNRVSSEYNLDGADIMTAKDLEEIVFSLDEDQILAITGFLPDPANLKMLDYSIVSEVIAYIMRSPLAKSANEGMHLPDFEDKIVFNNLSPRVRTYLYNGYEQVTDFERYLSNESNYLADSLREKINGVYLRLRELALVGDDLFWAIVNELSPKLEAHYQQAVIVVISKYFETCDVFEKP